MLVKVTFKRQVTFPKQVLDALGIGPGGRLELEASSDGHTLRPSPVAQAARSLGSPGTGSTTKLSYHPAAAIQSAAPSSSNSSCLWTADLFLRDLRHLPPQLQSPCSASCIKTPKSSMTDTPPEQA